METASRACNGQVPVWSGSRVPPPRPGLWWPVAIGNQCRGRRNNAETRGHGDQGGTEQRSLHGQLSPGKVGGLVSISLPPLSIPSVPPPTICPPLSLSPLPPLTLASRLEACLDLLVSTRRLPEAAFFARTYLPSQIQR